MLMIFYMSSFFVSLAIEDERNKLYLQNRKLQNKLTEAYERVTSLEAFMDQHKFARDDHSKAREQWETEKTFLYNELEKVPVLTWHMDLSRI